MMNGIVKILAGSLFILSLAGCGPSPENALTDYLDASLKGQPDKAYTYLSAADQKAQPFEDYKAKHTAPKSPLTQLVIDNVSYKILEIQEDGDSAKAKVEVTMPDLKALTKEGIKLAFAGSMDGKTPEDIQADIVEKYKTQEMPMSTEIRTLDLLKEDGEWKVSKAPNR